MRKGFLIYEEMRNCSILNFLIYEENFIFSFISAQYSTFHFECSAGILEQSMGTRNREGIGLSYLPTRLLRLAEKSALLGS
jgi:hypothetical protein